MKEIVIVCLAIDAETGAIDPTAPFVVISRQPRLQPHRGGVYHNEPDVIAHSSRASAKCGSRLSGPTASGSLASASPMLDRRRPRR